jgi:Lar family restriction alleviation protein
VVGKPDDWKTAYLDTTFPARNAGQEPIIITRLAWLQEHGTEGQVTPMAELLPCPFCGSTDIRYSLKVTGRFDVRYHASMYCNKCHCYGTRTLTKTVRHDDYKGRRSIEYDSETKQEAIEAWNRRAGDGK